VVAETNAFRPFQSSLFLGVLFIEFRLVITEDKSVDCAKLAILRVELCIDDKRLD